MILLIVYVVIALGFSFLCSIAEAVLLSVSNAHIALMEAEDHPAAKLLKELKDDVNKPLAAILTLNTIAHTVGAAGAGAQAAAVFGNTYVAIISAVLTLLILVFSEIIPKTLGAYYWKTLAPITAYTLRVLIWVLYPFVKLSQKLTSGMVEGSGLSGFSRAEFSAMVDLSAQEGQLGHRESAMLKNLLLLNNVSVEEIMTPRTVIFSLPENITVEAFFHKHKELRFSRIPIFSDGHPEKIEGFVLRNDLLLAQSRGNGINPLTTYCREMPAILETTSVAEALEKFMRFSAQMMLIVDEYGGVEGLVTLEDIFETMLGLEIVDENDKTVDMQQLALKIARRRREKPPQAGEHDQLSDAS